MKSSDTYENERFPQTRWSLILSGDQDPDLEELCRIYWGPIYGYLRRTGRNREDAEDLTQSFLASLSKNNSFSTADSQKGKLRTFLLGSLKRHLVDHQRAANAIKRGGGAEHLPLAISEKDLDEMDHRYVAEPTEEESPDQLFDQMWALDLLERTHQRIQRDYQQAGKGHEYETLKGALASARDIDRTSSARSLNVAENTVRVLIHRLRQNFRAALKEEIGETVGQREQVEEELRHLMNSF